MPTPKRIHYGNPKSRLNMLQAGTRWTPRSPSTAKSLGNVILKAFADGAVLYSPVKKSNGLKKHPARSCLAASFLLRFRREDEQPRGSAVAAKTPVAMPASPSARNLALYVLRSVRRLERELGIAPLPVPEEIQELAQLTLPVLDEVH